MKKGSRSTAAAVIDDPKSVSSPGDNGHSSAVPESSSADLAMILVGLQTMRAGDFAVNGC